MDTWVNYVASQTKSTGVYVGELTQVKLGDESEASAIIFVSCSKGQEFLFKEQLIEQQTEEDDDGDAGNSKPPSGITFQIFKNDQAEDEDGDDEEEDAEKDNKKDEKQERKQIHVRNVLIGPSAPNIHYFKMKKVGSFLIMQCQFDTYLNADAIQAECMCFCLQY